MNVLKSAFFVLFILFIISSEAWAVSKIKHKKFNYQMDSSVNAILKEIEDPSFNSHTSNTPTVPSKNKPKIFITEPFLLSKTDKATWFYTILKTYLFYKFSLFELFETRMNEPFFITDKPLYADKSKQYLKQCVTLALRNKSDFVFIPSYRIDSNSDSVIFSSALLSTKNKKMLLEKSVTFSLSDFNSKIDECMSATLAVINIKVDNKTNELFIKSPLVENVSSIQEFGDKLLNLNTSSDLLMSAETFKGMIDNEPTFALMVFTTAHMYNTSHKYEQSGNYFSHLIMRNGMSISKFFEAASKNYRMARAYDKAQRIIVLAENKSLSSDDLDIESTLVSYKGTYHISAYPVFQKVLERNPHDVDALLFFIRYHKSNREFEKALQLINTLLATDSTNFELYTEKAKILLSLKKYDESKQCIIMAQSINSIDSAVALCAGDIEFNVGNYQAAIHNYTTVLDKYPENKDVVLKIAESYRRSDNPHFAIDVLKKNKAIFNHDDYLYKRQYGLAAFTIGDTAKAFALLQHIPQKFENDTTVLFAMIDLCSTTGQYELASQYISQVKPLVHDKQKILFYIARLALAKKDMAKAKEVLLKIHKNNPANALTNYYLGTIFKDEGNYPSSLFHFLKYQSIDSTNTSVRLIVCQLYYKMNDMVNSEKEASKLIDRDPENAQAYVILSLVALRKKDSQAAQKYITIAQRMVEIDDTIYKQFASILYSSGQYEKAIEAYRTYLDKKPDDRDALITLSKIYSQMHNDTLVAKTYVTIASYSPQNQKKYFSSAAGKMFFKLGMKKKAYEVYSQYLKEFGLINREVVYNTAILEFEMRNYTTVIGLLTSKQLSIDRTATIDYYLGVSYYATSQYKEAISYLKNYLISNSNSIEAAEMLCDAYEHENMFGLAIFNFEKYLICKQSDKKNEYLFSIAILYEKLNDKSRAMNQYQKNIRLAPDDIRNYERLASLYTSDAKYTQAITLLQRAVKLPSVPYDFFKKIAELYRIQGNFPLAIKTYEFYLTNAPADTGALFSVGMMYYKLQHFNKAVTPLTKMYEISPTHVTNLYTLGMSHMQMNEFEKASFYFNEALKIKNNDQTLAKLLTKCYQATKDTARLLEIYELRSATEINNYDFCSQYGHLLLKAGKTDKAVHIFKKALNLNPKNISIHLMLINVFKSTSDYSNLNTYLESAISLAPKNPALYLERALLYLQMKDSTRAKDDLNKTLSLDPHNALANYYLGTLLFKEDDFKQAFYLFKNAVTLQPNNINYLSSYAEVASKVNQLKTAIIAIDKALSIDPENIKLLQMAGTFYYLTKNNDVAQHYLERALEKDGDCFECKKILGLIHYQNNEYDRSISFMKNAYNQMPNNDSLLFFLAQLYEKNSESKKALSLYEEKFKQNPKNDFVFYKLCSALIEAGNIKEAENYIKNNNSTHKSGLRFLTDAKLYEALGKNSLAAHAYDAAVRLLPQNKDAIIGKGKLCLLKKDFTSAIQISQYVLKLNPGNENALLLLGKAYFGLQEYLLAKQLFEEVMTKNSQNREAYYLLGSTFIKLNKFYDAITTLETGINLDKKDSKMIYALGVAYEYLKEYQDAISRYLEVVRLDKSKEIMCYEKICMIYLTHLEQNDEAKKYYKKYTSAGGTNSKIKALMQEKSGVY